MAQADQSVQNATFPTVRADINNNLAALFSANSGNTAPSVTVAFQDWIDTSGTDPLWKKRNAANNAWITLGTIDGNDIAFEGTLPDQSGNSGKFLGTDGTDASWAALALGASMQVFTNSGTFTPTAGKTSFLVFCTGGGGGSGDALVGGGFSSAATGGGGGGGTAIRFYDATEMGGSGAVTVGSGGGAGSTGGTSTYDSDGSGLTITGVGGSGSPSATNGFGNGSNGGGSTNAQIECSGSQGLRAFSSSLGAGGGVSFWAQGRGGGAVGAVRAGAGTTGGNAGTAGIVVILEW
jgi:hypothetical protein